MIDMYESMEILSLFVVRFLPVSVSRLHILYFLITTTARVYFFFALYYTLGIFSARLSFDLVLSSFEVLS